MSAPPPIQPGELVEQIQLPDTGGEGYVELFELYLAPAIGGATDPVRFTPNSGAGAYGPVFRGGERYAPLPCESSGFDKGGDGLLPQPQVRISNVLGFLDQEVHAYDDLVGALVRRILTLTNYLDDGPDADPDAAVSDEVFTIEQKTEHSQDVIGWRLTSQLDRPGRKLPPNQALRDTCPLRYRIADPGGGFDYSTATCPYVGAALFDYKNDPTADESRDQCRKNLAACKLRFPGQPLPTRAFPGLGARR